MTKIYKIYAHNFILIYNEGQYLKKTTQNRFACNDLVWIIKKMDLRLELHMIL